MTIESPDDDGSEDRSCEPPVRRICAFPALVVADRIAGLMKGIEVTPYRTGMHPEAFSELREPMSAALLEQPEQRERASQVDVAATLQASSLTSTGSGWARYMRIVCSTSNSASATSSAVRSVPRNCV